MDEMRIVTCSAPINIAVIKYCESPLEPLVVGGAGEVLIYCIRTCVCAICSHVVVVVFLSTYLQYKM